jgi:hypothetical protein
MNFCLLAIGGDCAAGGMSHKSDFIPLQEFNETLKEFLRNQLELEIECFTMNPEKQSLRFGALVLQHHDLGNKLIDQGIFAHKWHKRTDWIICELENELPLNHSGGPFNRCDVKGESK